MSVRGIPRSWASVSTAGCWTRPPTFRLQFAGTGGIASEIKYAGNAFSGVSADDGNSGASRLGEKTNPSNFSFQLFIAPRKLITGRLSHPARSDAAAAPAAPMTNLRRVRTLATLASGDHVDDLPRMHRDQHQMARDEQSEQAQDAKMHDASAIVAAERNCQEMQLQGFVDREPREHHHDSENYRRGVRETLEAVVEAGGRRRPADSHVVRELPQCVYGVASRNKQAAAPFAAREKVRHVDEAVDYEEPRDREMPMASAGEPSADAHPFGWRHVLERIPRILRAARTEGRIGSENFEAAPGHQREEDHIAPVDDANRQGLLAPPFEAGVCTGVRRVSRAAFHGA